MRFSRRGAIQIFVHFTFAVDSVEIHDVGLFNIAIVPLSFAQVVIVISKVVT